MNKREYAWAAGFFDGEGSITYPEGRFILHVQQNAKEPLSELERILGGKVYGPYTRTRKRTGNEISKPFWYWRAQGAAGRRAYGLMIPYLRLKRLPGW